MSTSLSISLVHDSSLYITKSHAESIASNTTGSSHVYQEIPVSTLTVVDMNSVDGDRDRIFIRNTTPTNVKIGSKIPYDEDAYLIDLGQNQATVFPMRAGATIYAYADSNSIIEVICIEVT